MVSVGVDRFNKIITNLYTAVFEKGVPLQNSIFRAAVTVADRLSVTEDSVTLEDCIPTALYYAPLTITGSYTKAGGLVAGITVKAPPATFSKSVGWVVARIRPSWAYNTALGYNPNVFRIEALSTTDTVRLIFNDTTNQWNVVRDSAAATAAFTYNHTALEDITVAAMWDLTTIYISVNGGAWVSTASVPVANSVVDAFIGTNPNIVGKLEGIMHWMVAGRGAITVAMVTALHALGNASPEDWCALPFTHAEFVTADPRFLWDGVDADHVPTAVYGENMYA